MKKLLLILALILVIVRCAMSQEGFDFTTSQSIKTNYICILGPVAYDKPVWQNVISLSKKDSYLGLWSSFGVENGTFHEVDIFAGHTFDLDFLTLNIEGLIWFYPDKTLSNNSDFVSIITLEKEISFLNFKLQRFDIYPHKEMKKGSGYLFNICPFNFESGKFSGDFSIESFYSRNFYSLEGWLQFRANSNLNYEITKAVKLNLGAIYQLDGSTKHELYEGFIFNFGVTLIN